MSSGVILAPSWLGWFPMYTYGTAKSSLFVL